MYFNNRKNSELNYLYGDTENSNT